MMTEEEVKEWDRKAAIEEAISDACDYDGISAGRLEDELAKRGLYIAAIKGEEK